MGCSQELSPRIRGNYRDSSKTWRRLSGPSGGLSGWQDSKTGPTRFNLGIFNRPRKILIHCFYPVRAIGPAKPCVDYPVNAVTAEIMQPISSYAIIFGRNFPTNVHPRELSMIGYLQKIYAE